MNGPRSHQEVADEWNADMRATSSGYPLTRLLVAAEYWRLRAVYWRQKAMSYSRCDDPASFAPDKDSGVIES